MIRVGIAGWAYADWDGRVYPKPRPGSFDPLAYLARYVDLMEVNSTFYALPRPTAVAAWLTRVQAQPEFCFSAKLHQELTHGSGPTEERVTAFRVALEPLLASPRLRALLAQFPYSFAPGHGAMERVTALRSAFCDVPLLFELRRREWFEPPWAERLRRLDVWCVDLDLPAHARHPGPEPVPGGGLRYMRLHGRNAATWFDPTAGRDQRYDHRYLPGELRDVETRLRAIAALGSETLVVTNNHFQGKAVAAALELKAALAHAPVAMPATLLETYPDLRPYARPEGQLPLFG